MRFTAVPDLVYESGFLAVSTCLYTGPVLSCRYNAATMSKYLFTSRSTHGTR